MYMGSIRYRAGAMILLFGMTTFSIPNPVFAAYHFYNFKGIPPIHVYTTTKTPIGITPSEIKRIYGLPSSGGKGTIVIIAAYYDAQIESDLAVFNKQFGLSSCTTANGCFTRHMMKSSEGSNSSWTLETSLDVEWAHAIAPDAKIMLVEATTPSGANLLKALDYAASVPDAVAISMSWGGTEFPEEVSLDSHFKSVSDAVFFASSGDKGTGASWPASSSHVIGVGGTSLVINSSGTLSRETAWSGSGGGISMYEKEPNFQSNYSIPKAGGMRAIPDVSYNADPASGFPIYHAGKWRTVGGTSAGAPQWAAIAALGSGVTLSNLYNDKSKNDSSSYFRDIVSGSNGDCGYICNARAHYDYVTGLGSPLTSRF
jgi:subtilase family serine protease